MRAALVVGLLLASRTAFAADSPDARDHTFPCRPTVSCNADIAVAGTLEIEGGLLFNRSDTTKTWTYPFLLKQTFARWLQLQVTSNGLTTQRGASNARYLDNLEVGPKFHFFDQGKIRPSLALTALLSIPTFEADGYTRLYDALFTGHVSKDMGPIHADWNVGLNVLGLDSPVTQELTALALSMTLAGPVGIALEGYVFSDAAPVAPRDGGVRSAISLTTRPWMVFDLGGDVGFFPSVRAYSLFVGMTFVAVVFWRPKNR